MKLEEFPGLLTPLRDWIIEWLDCLRHPFLSIERALLTYNHDKDRFQYALRLWLIGFLLMLALQLPIYKFLGMDWQDIGFLLPSALLVLLLFFTVVIAIHLGLQTTGVRSNLADTFLIYAVITVAHAPFFSLLYYPLEVDFLSSLHTLKSQGKEFEEALRTALAQREEVSLGKQAPSVIRLVSEILWYPMGFLYAGTMLIIVQRALAAHYDMTRYQILLGMSLGMGVFMILPVLFILLIYLLLIFSML